METGGKWLVYNLKGHLHIVVNNLSDGYYNNAVVSGVFFGN
jgi:hypothetical protein